MTILSPRELREMMVRDYIRTMQIDARAAERLAIKDLELVDAARRAGDIKETQSPKAPDPHRDRPDPLKKAQAETNTRLNVTDGESQYDRYSVLHSSPLSMGTRWAFAVGRLRRIIEGASQAGDVRVAADTAGIPRLARKWAALWWSFMQRGSPPPKNGRIDHNEFRGMSDRDACRLLMRRAEDICDESTGVMGPWFVPK